MTIRDGIGVEALVAQANAEVETISVAQAAELSARDDVVVVDIRDVRELKREGKVPGAMHVPRGMLEFWIDPASPYAKAVFEEDRRFVFYCSLGWRSALATQTAQRMGLCNACHIEGGFTAWKEAGLPVEQTG